VKKKKKKKLYLWKLKWKEFLLDHKDLKLVSLKKEIWKL
jgi:hypothetical protein